MYDSIFYTMPMIPPYKLYFCTYAPLAQSKAGRIAAATFGLPPFIDGSIRREPDLQHDYPSISCLCRTDRFAPRLRVEDRVVYLTKKSRRNRREPHWRMTAILEVFCTLKSHADAASWYRERKLPLPNNCLVPGNGPNDVSRSHRINENKHLSDPEFTHRWDLSYQLRARRHPTFVVCKKLFAALDESAPVVYEHQLTSVFGQVPATRTPAALDAALLPRLLDQLCVASTT